MTGSNATFRFYSPSVMHYHYPFYLYLLTFFHLMENMSYISHLSLLFYNHFVIFAYTSVAEVYAFKSWMADFKPILSGLKC